MRIGRQKRKVRRKQEKVTFYKVTTNLHIYLAMMSQDVEMLFTYFANCLLKI